MGGEDSDKIIRIPGETLRIEVTSEEVKYRNKYLPDPKKLTDEKLVCTVCSVPLAQNIHKGKDIFVHRALQVLVCEVCYNFYGDGCFSTDEDGDDKYCRWCGQGGTLFLCSACNCAFCQKCTKQNLKASVLADLDNDDWKCYICNPRPLFGCRTICWGAQELNKIGKEKENERLKKQKERLEKLLDKKNEKEERKSRKKSVSEDDVSTKKRKTRGSDSDTSSPEVMPTKKIKRESKVSAQTKNLNGSISKTRRRRKDSSSSSDSDYEKKVTRPSRSSSKKGKSLAESSSEDDSDIKSKRKNKLKKKKVKTPSDDSSDDDKKKSKRRSNKKKADSSDEESLDEKQSKKKKLLRKKKEDVSDSSSDEKQKKKKIRKKKDSSSEDSSGDNKKKPKRNLRKKKESSSDEESEDSTKKRTKKNKGKLRKKDEVADSDSESKRGKKISDTEELKVNAISAEDLLVKKRIKLAILWLNNAVKDISELGTLISVRATKFCQKKINAENLKTYDDVLSTVTKLRQLISGVHSNYDHIEKSLDAQLKPWKILTGLEEPDNDKTVEGDTSIANIVNFKAVDGASIITDENNVDNKSDANVNSSILSSGEKSNEMEVDSETKVEVKEQNKDDEMTLQWSGLSADDDSDNEEQNATKALISKANKTLEEGDEEEQKSEKSQDSSDGKKINKNSEAINDKSTNDTLLEDSTQETNHNETMKSNSSVEDNHNSGPDDSDEKAKKKMPSKNKNEDSLGSSKKDPTEKSKKDEKSSKVAAKNTDSKTEMETSPKENTESLNESGLKGDIKQISAKNSEDERDSQLNESAGQ